MVEFFPEKAKLPITSSADRAIEAANDLAEALKHFAPESSFKRVGDEQLEAIKKLQQIFANQINTKNPSKPTNPQQSNMKTPAPITQRKTTAQKGITPLRVGQTPTPPPWDHTSTLQKTLNTPLK